MYFRRASTQFGHDLLREVHRVQVETAILQYLICNFREWLHERSLSASSLSHYITLSRMVSHHTTRTRRPKFMSFFLMFLNKIKKITPFKVVVVGRKRNNWWFCDNSTIFTEHLPIYMTIEFFNNSDAILNFEHIAMHCGLSRVISKFPAVRVYFWDTSASNVNCHILKG